MVGVARKFSILTLYFRIPNTLYLMSHAQIQPPSTPIDPISDRNAPWHPQAPMVGVARKFSISTLYFRIPNTLYFMSHAQIQPPSTQYTRFLTETPPDTPRVGVAQILPAHVTPRYHSYLCFNFQPDWFTGVFGHKGHTHTHIHGWSYLLDKL